MYTPVSGMLHSSSSTPIPNGEPSDMKAMVAFTDARKTSQ